MVVEFEEGFIVLESAFEFESAPSEPLSAPWTISSCESSLEKEGWIEGVSFSVCRGDVVWAPSREGRVSI